MSRFSIRWSSVRTLGGATRITSSSRTSLLAGLALAILASLAGPSRPALAATVFEVVKGFEVTRGHPSVLVMGSDGALYGIAAPLSGSTGNGTVFRIDSAGTVTSLHAFTGAEVAYPAAALVVGSDGALYGTTQRGGSSGYGTVFRIDSTGTFTSLHSFTGTDGAHPAAALVVGSDGALYGTTEYGGPGGGGTVFRIDSAGIFTSLHSFENTDPEYPSINPALVVGSDGALYGTTSGGGPSAYGIVFRIDSAGTFTPLHAFTGADGAVPAAALVVGSDGALYGTTYTGGSSGQGTVFRIDSAGTFTSLHSFAGTDGAHPAAALVVGSDGALYGTTQRSSSDFGTVFRIDSAGTFTSLGIGIRGNPSPVLVVGGDGALYGTSQTGGSSGYGTVFRIDSAWTFTSLHEFTGWDGFWPAAALVVGSDSALYGTTYGGGSSGGNGIVFRIDSAGTFTSLHSFGASTDGAEPYAALVVGSDGALYGTTYFGGSSGNSGTVFRIDSAGTFTSLHSFTGTDGANPRAALVVGSDEALYGTAGGTVFQIDSAGTFTSLHSFTGADGAFPGGLVMGSDGALYGTTVFGGSSGFGTIFRIDSEGPFTSLHSFTGADGTHPQHALVMGSDGALYGTTGSGGSSGNYGTVFRIDSAGTFTSLHSFTGTDGAYPAALVVGSDGALYGTTQRGGSSDYGTVFRIDSAGTFTSLHSFTGTDGANPVAALVVGSDGALYGTTYGGGSSGGNGTVFRIDSAGTFTSLHAFTGADGARPAAALVVGSDGALYGITYFGGSSGYGTAFRIDSAETFTTLHSFENTDGVHPAPLVVGSDCALYGTTVSGGPGDGGVVFRLFEAGHLCQGITFDPLPDRSFADPPFTVRATASSGLPVSFTASGSCTVSGDQVALTGAGLCTLTASQVGDADYEPAPDVSQSFHVLFDFQGFLPPLADPPTLNPVHAGRTVPVAFEIASDPGPGVLAGALVRRVDCDTLAPQGGYEPASSPGASGLRSAGGRYALPWKTDRGWAGTCREFALDLIDGSVQRAYFSFKSRPLASAHRGAH